MIKTKTQKEHKFRHKLEVVFYRTEQGVEPVREWLKALSKADKKAIGVDVKTVQFGWPLGMPLVGNLGQGLWEVRIKLRWGRIARIIFFMDNNSMVALLKIKWVNPCSFDEISWKISRPINTGGEFHGHAQNIRQGVRNRDPMVC